MAMSFGPAYRFRNTPQLMSELNVTVTTHFPSGIRPIPSTKDNHNKDAMFTLAWGFQEDIRNTAYTLYYSV